MDNQIQPSVSNTPSTTGTPTQTQLSQKKTSTIRVGIVIFTYLLFFPLGIFLMWFWMNQWPKGLKIALTAIPLIIIFGGLGLVYYSYSVINGVYPTQ